MQPPYWWAAVAAIAWPLAQLVLFVGRFGRWPEGSPLAGLAASLVFAPLGALSGLWLVWLVRRARQPRARQGAIAGYLVATPLAFMGALLGPLSFPPLVGATVFGTVPLVVGSAAGFMLGDHLG